MNAIVPQNFGPLSARFVNKQIENDLAAGISSSYGLIGYKGKVWSIRYRGDDKPLMREDGDGARGSIEVVLLKSNTHLSKIYYEAGYVEGSTAPPDCFSNNGLTPDPSSAKKQHTVCASCPKNVWGSRITPAGKAGKLCADSKRVAVVPLGDVENSAYGGPMLLRVPGASLNDLASFGNKMAGLGYPYNSIGVRISFDTNESYPKFVFSAIRPLTDAEADQVMAHLDGLQVARVLSEDPEGTALPAPTATAEQVFEQPPAPAPAAAPVAASAPVAEEPPKQKRNYKKTPEKAPEPVATKAPVVDESKFLPESPVEDEASDLDDDLDAKLNAIMGS